MSGEVAVFAGTTEGRELCERLSACGRDARAFTATDYGEALVSDLPGIEVHAGRLDEEGMAVALRGCKTVVDATHPFAVEASRTIAAACARTGSRYVRLARGRLDEEGEAVRVASVSDAAAYLRAREGCALVTTGSKEAHAFASPELLERVYLRVLPDASAIARLRGLGFPAARIIAMQGPFSRELNAAMLKQIDARWLVTKSSGAAGGEGEKLAAARDAGARVVLVERPVERAGACSFDEVCSLLGV